MNKQVMKLDANEFAFFKRELEHIKSRFYDTKQRLLRYQELLPIDRSAPPGATEITYRRFTQIGEAIIIADYASDLPRVDVFGEEVTQKVREIGDMYGYSIKEIRAAAMARRSLQNQRFQAAVRAIKEKLNRIAWEGDVNSGLNGFIDYPGLTEYTVPNDGSGSSKEWTTKTPDQIIRDMAGIVTAVVSATNGVAAPDTMLLPIDQYNYIANTRMTGDSDRSIMKYFMENNPYINRIAMLEFLAGAGASSTDRMMVYRRDPNLVTFELPLEFEQLSPQENGLEFEVPCWAVTGGVIVYYPTEIAYADGI